MTREMDDHFSSFRERAEYSALRRDSRDRSADRFYDRYSRDSISNYRNKNDRDDESWEREFSCCSSKMKREYPRKFQRYFSFFRYAGNKIISCVLFVKNAPLTSAFAVIILTAVSWNYLPHLKVNVRHFFPFLKENVTDIVVDHQFGTESDKPDELDSFVLEDQSCDAEELEMATAADSEQGSVQPSPAEVKMVQLAEDFEPSKEPIPTDTARKMDSLGVKNAKLQRWGKSGHYWRYSCEAVPISADKGYSKYFEAVGESPNEVLETVYLKVQRWQAEPVAALPW